MVLWLSALFVCIMNQFLLLFFFDLDDIEPGKSWPLSYLTPTPTA